jgi:chromosome segregation ATPase
MKKISLWVLALFLTASIASAQDAATQQQIDKLSGQLQDLTEAQVRINQRLDNLEKVIGDLREKVNTPVVNDYATQAELKDLVEQMRKIDKNRKEDTENIVKQIENLAKAAATPPPAPVTHSHKAPKPEPDDTASSKSNTGEYEYEVHPGDNLGLIIKKAYKEKGVKVTKSQLIAANPKMNPNVLIPGEKLVIPDSSAK